MNRTLYLTIISVLLLACAAKVPYFIPQSSLTQKEIEDSKKRLVVEFEWTKEEVESLIGDGTNMRKFRDEDIRSAFPELEATDTKFSLCSNSIMGGAARVVFLSLPKENTVIVKSSECRRVEEGLQCEPLESRERYYYKKPQNAFSIEAGVSYAEAINILSLYEKNGIKDLPKGYQGFKPSNVNTIRKTAEGFHLSIGEVFCGGCSAQIQVKIDNDQLVLIGTPKGMCI